MSVAPEVDGNILCNVSVFLIPDSLFFVFRNARLVIVTSSSKMML